MSIQHYGKFIGIIPPSAFGSLAYVKQLLLMFDCLAVDIGQKGLTSESRAILQKSMGDIGRLTSEGMLTLMSGLMASNQLAPSEEDLIRARKMLGGEKQVTHERFNAFLLRKKGIDAVPITGQFEDSDLDEGADRDVVVRLTLREFPVPSDGTAWESVRDFRDDEEAKNRYWNLRRWINKAASSGLKKYEVLDELRGLLSDYNGSMNLHKMKQKTGTFEILVTTTAAVVEGIARLKFSEAVKPLFDIHKQDVKLLEDEKNMPGKEVAYIAYAADKFAGGIKVP